MDDSSGALRNASPGEIFLQLHHDLVDLAPKAIIEVEMRHIRADKYQVVIDIIRDMLAYMPGA